MENGRANLGRDSRTVEKKRERNDLIKIRKKRMAKIQN